MSSASAIRVVFMHRFIAKRVPERHLLRPLNGSFLSGFGYPFKYTLTLAPGSRLGPYEIATVLDAGGMGEVYRARDPRIARDVAIKILPASFSHDRDRLRRFEREARAAGALNHPVLLTIFDVGEQNGTSYLVSELLEGETLRTRLSGGPLSPRRAVEYAIQIARGLAAAHDRGVVHRDIKPENIFITKDGRLKILDFGLAKLHVPSSDAEKTGPVMGTPGYMSPEQVRGEEADQRSDIFALGTVLYECLAGTSPFKRDTSVETMNAVLTAEPAEVPAGPGLVRVVTRCLEKHREARYQSAADFAFHLESLTDPSAFEGEPLDERLKRAPLGVAEVARVMLAKLTRRAAGTGDPRADVYSAGGVLYELLTGRLVAGKDPPNLGGSEAIVAMNRIIHRALATEPRDRYQSLQAMANDLRAVMLIPDVSARIAPHPLTRLIVLPFQILRADPETDFLALALPVAITSSLTGLRSVVVRSPSAGGAFTGNALDFAKLKNDLDIDLVMTGTMVRAGDQLRVTCELAEVPTGTVAWAYNAQLALTDLFQLQDELTRRIVGSLELPLTDRELRLLRGNVPATPRAHEYYLRAGQLSQSAENWYVARDLYLRALEEDPHYAPAWARLARVHLLLGKYVGNADEEYKAAESALRKALEINADLPIAHHVYALLEVRLGRAKDAVLRLMDRVAQGTNDVDVFGGLVLACRYAGLLEASVAAHEQARRLDPRAATSAYHSYWMLGQFDRALEAVNPDRDPGGEAALIYALMGDAKAGLRVLEERENRLGGAAARETFLGQEIHLIRALLTRDFTAALPLLDRFRDFPDPEGLYYLGRSFAYFGKPADALELLDLAVTQGFFCFGAYASDPWLDGLRAEPAFVAILNRAEARTRDAQAAFAEHPASRILAVGVRS
jgi:serine/threonine protein kinase/tetratricopeptide (TPR) repeat protein